VKSSNTPKKKKTEAEKISIGSDEFCLNCMEWREFDEEGRCKICGKLVKKEPSSGQRKKDNEFGIDGSSDESDYELDQNVE